MEPIGIVAVTGSSGYLGRRLIERLSADPRVDRIVGIDVREPLAGSPALEFHLLDVREARLPKVLAGCDALVHLAAAVDPLRDGEAMRSVNVDGTRNALESAAAAGAGHLVYVSSAAAYGALQDNPVPLAEDHPLRAEPSMPGAAHKREAEEWLASFAQAHPEATVSVLRPAMVLGPDVDSFISRHLEAPRLLSVRGYEPPLQFVHEDDVASALHLVLRRRLAGAYNVACDGWLSLDEVARLAGRRRLTVPEGPAFSMASALWRAGLVEAPPGELSFLMHPWVVDNAKLRAAGWRPLRSNSEAVEETAEARKGWTTIGRARFRRADLVAVAGAGAGIAAAVAAARRRTRSG